MEFALLRTPRYGVLAAVAMYLCALNIVSYATGSNQSSPLMQHDNSAEKNTKKTTTNDNINISSNH